MREIGYTESMEPHAVPRQITTFEFKLIGFLTLKEFAYLIVFAGFAAIAYFIAPFELAKYISAAFVFGIGAFFAFFKYNDRSIDVWIRNLAIKLFTSSQYYYRKHNDPPSFLRDIVYDKQIATLHVDAKQKLSGYLKNEPARQSPLGGAKAPNNSTSGVLQTPNSDTEESVEEPMSADAERAEIIREATPVEPDSVVAPKVEARPILSGLVKNNKDLPLPNILVYVKDKDGQVARILKTNSNGAFSTTRPFDENSYTLEPKDSSNRFFFDTININPSSVAEGVQPLIIRSKETL